MKQSWFPRELQSNTTTIFFLCLFAEFSARSYAALCCYYCYYNIKWYCVPFSGARSFPPSTTHVSWIYITFCRSQMYYHNFDYISLRRMPWMFIHVLQLNSNIIHKNKPSTFRLGAWCVCVCVPATTTITGCCCFLVVVAVWFVRKLILFFFRRYSSKI